MTEPPKPRQFANFTEAFRISFKEEIVGETFFAALAQTEPDPRRAALWAKLSLIEARTVAAMRPLAVALGVIPADELALRRSGRIEAAEWQNLPFAEVMAIMVRDYPTGYVEEFRSMLPMAPPEARDLVQLLIDHEVAMVDMAKAEIAGTGDPAAPLDAYLLSLANHMACNENGA